MKNILIIATLVSLIPGANAQHVVARVSPSTGKTEIKWYDSKLTNESGFVVYRRISGSSDWVRITEKPVCKGAYIPSRNELRSDPTLSLCIQSIKGNESPEGIALLVAVVKTFTSVPLCKFLGIYYCDSTTFAHKRYEYKVARLAGDEETQVGISAPVTAGKYVPEAPPADITFKPVKKQVHMHWKPEPTRYYAVNIYRRYKDSARSEKLNAQPVMISKTRRKDGTTGYPDAMFSDEKVTTGATAYYSLEAIDFFGSPSIRSKEIRVVLKDEISPAAPTHVKCSSAGFKTRITWEKNDRESDLRGYHIYRTLRNDTDFARLTDSPLSPETLTFSDEVTRDGGFFYKVSAIDHAGNEAFSMPCGAESVDNVPPATPAKITAEGDSGRITLTWNAVHDKDLLGYLVYRGTISDTNGFVKLTPKPFAASSYIDTLPSNAKNSFYYRVAAVDKTHNRGNFTKVVRAQMPDVIAPSAPFITAAVVNEKKQIVVSWFANAEPDLASYQLFREDADSVRFKVISRRVGRESAAYIDETTDPGVRYRYYLTATDSAGNVSGKSNIIRASTPAERKAQPTVRIVSATYSVKSHEMHLAWKSTKDPELGFMLYRRGVGEAEFIPVTTLTDKSHVTDIVKPDSKYCYQVRAYDRSGHISRSEIFTAETTLNP